MTALALALVLAAHAKTPLYTGTASPWTLAAGQGTIGVFHPVSHALTDRTELSTTGLFSLVAPRLEVKHTALSSAHWGLGFRLGLGTPTPALRLARGTLLPSNVEVPWVGVVGVAPVVGWRGGDWNVSLTSQVRMALGVSDLEPLDLGWGFDAMLAPLTEGWCVLERLVVDWHPGDAWVVSGEAGVQAGGGPDWRWRAFVLRRLGAHTALGAGGWLTLDTGGFGQALYGAPLVDFQGRW